MPEVTGTVIRIKEHPERESRGKIPVGILLAVPSQGEVWWNCWDKTKLAGIQEGNSYSFVTEKRVGKDKETVYENIVGFAQDEGEDKWERAARDVDRQTGAAQPAQTHVAAQTPNHGSTSWRYTKEAIELEEDCTNRRTALMQTVAYYGLPDLEGQRPSFANFTETYRKMLGLLQGMLRLPAEVPSHGANRPTEAREEAGTIPQPTNEEWVAFMKRCSETLGTAPGPETRKRVDELLGCNVDLEWVGTGKTLREAYKVIKQAAFEEAALEAAKE